MKWILIGYVAAVLVCVGWKIRYVVAANMNPAAPILEAPAAANSDATKSDRQIIEDALALLESDPHWTQNDDEFCVPGQPLTLYCALAIAAKVNGRNLAPADSITARVNATILQTADNPAHYPSPAARPFAVILAFNNHASSDRDAVIGILTQSLARNKPL